MEDTLKVVACLAPTLLGRQRLLGALPLQMKSPQLGCCSTPSMLSWLALLRRGSLHGGTCCSQQAAKL